MFRRFLQRFRSCRRRNTRSFQSLTPALECLEDRCLLTGNVASTLLAPNFLLLTGDNLDNEIRIQGDGSVGGFRIRGIHGTTIDGERTQSFSGIDRISLVLGDGDDSVTISHISFANVNTTGQLSLTGILVRAGAGNDTVRISNSSIVADGAGLTDDAQAFITVEGDIGPDPGGNDDIRIFNVSVEATGATRRTFAQIDVFGDIATSSGGDDVATVRNAHVFAHGGSVSNLALIDLQELSGGGNDVFSVLNSDTIAEGANATGRVTIETGDGDDVAVVRNSNFDRLQARLGSGNDKMVLRNNIIGILAFLDGGAGDDELIAKNNSGTIVDRGFEE